MPVEEKEIEKLLDSFLDEVTDAIFSRSQENIVRNKTSDTGQLLIRANVNREFLEKEIVYEMPYAAFIEFGTQPHFMGRQGIEALTNWCHRKVGLPMDEAKSMAFAVAKKISKEGTDPQPFLRPAIDEVIERGVEF